MLPNSRVRNLTHSHTPLTMTHTLTHSRLQTHTPALMSPSTPALTWLLQIMLPSPSHKPRQIPVLPKSLECFRKTCAWRLIWIRYPIGPHTLSVTRSHTCRALHRGLVGQTLSYPIILPCSRHSGLLLWVASQGWVSMAGWALYGQVELASDTSSARSVGRVSPRRRVWTHTCAFTLENGHTAVSSVGSVSHSPDTSRLTRLSTPEKDRTNAPAVGNDSQGNSTSAYTPRNTTLTCMHFPIYRVTHSRTHYPKTYTGSQQRMQDTIFDVCLLVLIYFIYSVVVCKCAATTKKSLK